MIVFRKLYRSICVFKVSFDFHSNIALAIVFSKLLFYIIGISSFFVNFYSVCMLRTVQDIICFFRCTIDWAVNLRCNSEMYLLNCLQLGKISSWANSINCIRSRFLDCEIAPLRSSHFGRTDTELRSRALTMLLFKLVTWYQNGNS